MSGEVFQANKVFVFSTVAILNIVFIVAYFTLQLPIWFLLIAIPISIVIGISAIKTKIIIEDGYLHYVTWARGEKVDLMNVSQIVRREVETIGQRVTSSGETETSGITFGKVTIGGGEEQERKIEKVMYVIDKDGRTFFSFPASMIKYKHRDRFSDAVHAINPEVEID